MPTRPNTLGMARKSRVGSFQEGGRLKRRIYHLAKIANISPEIALQALRRTGYGFKDIHDQVAISSVSAVQKALNQENPSIKMTKSGRFTKTDNDPKDILPSRGKTKTLPRRKSGKSRSSVHYLDSGQILNIHYALVQLFVEENDPISPSGPKDEGLLESATHRPQTSLGNVEKYKSIHAKASALFHSLILNHPFHNGNKRTALVSLVIFLDLNKIRMEASDDDLFDFVIRTANRHQQPGEGSSTDAEVSRIEEWLRSHSMRVDDQATTMAVKDFLEAVSSAGGHYRHSRDEGTWIAWGPNGDSVSIGRSIPELTGSVVKRYIQKLGLSQGLSGIHFDEFHEGLDPEQKLIRGFRMVLRRLSHT